jgi:hypothetical protein
MKLVCAFLIILFIALSGCSGQAPEASPEPQPKSPPESETTPSQTSDDDTSEEPDTSSQVILKYWEAMNSYNLGRALSYYEEQYREQEEEEVAGDIGMLKQFGVTLSVLEVSEPVYMSEDKVRHDIILETPIDERGLSYLLERIDGEWKIYLENNTEDFTEVKEFIIDFLTKYGESQRMDIMINAEQQIGMQRATTEYGLAELAESGEIIEPRPGVYSLPGE